MAAVVVATVVALAGSLAADAALVALGTAIFPSTRGYVHFAFGDYAKLTVIGVVVACAAWPVVTRLTSAPRWLSSARPSLVTLVPSSPTSGSSCTAHRSRRWRCSWPCTWPSPS